MSGKNVNEIEKREQAAAAAGGPTYYTQSYQLSTYTERQRSSGGTRSLLGEY